MADYNLMNEKVTTDQNGNVISSASLSPTPIIQTVTPTPDTTNYAGITGGVTQSVINDYATLNAQQKDAQASQVGTGSDILTLMNQISGKTADTQAANESAGVNTETANLNTYTQQLADLNAQASSLNREAQAVPIQVQQNNQGTGATDRGVSPQSAGALRLNALKALSIGQQSDIAAAAATGSQIRLQAAKDKAQQIVDLKYKPLEDQLALKQKQYDLNKDALDAIDKKRSEALSVALNKEAQDLADKKANDKQIQDLMVEAAKSGASQDTINAIQKATSPQEAIALASYDLGATFRQTVAQNEFDNKIKQQQLALSQESNSLSRARLNLDIQKEAFDQVQKSAGAVSPVMQQSIAKSGIDLTTGLLTDTGLASAVGPNALARGGINLPFGLGIPTSLKGFTGERQNFIAGVEQLISQLNLQSLIDAKSKGATFGALSDQELQVLANSATKLGAWAVKDSKGNVTGYNINEKDFRNELDKINNFAKLDYVLKGGNPTDVGIKQTPDGKYWSVNSNGTLTELQ